MAPPKGKKYVTKAEAKRNEANQKRLQQELAEKAEQERIAKEEEEEARRLKKEPIEMKKKGGKHNW